MLGLVSEALPYVLGGATALVGSLVGGATTSAVAVLILTIAALCVKRGGNLRSQLPDKSMGEPLLTTIVVAENEHNEREREVRTRHSCTLRCPRQKLRCCLRVQMLTVCLAILVCV